MDHPLLVFGFEFVPRRVTRNTRVLGVAHEVVLAFLPGRRLHRLDGARAQRKFVVRKHQAIVDTDHAPETAAGLARPHSGVERKRRRNRIRITQVAIRAMQARGEFPDARLVGVGQCIHADAPAAAFEGGLDRFQNPGAFGITEPEAVGHHIQYLAFAGSYCIGFDLGFLVSLFLGGGGNGAGRHLDFALRLHARIPTHRQPLGYLVRRGVHR